MATELMTYFDKCRCCFASIGKRKKNWSQVDKTIENRFFNLSNIELKSSSLLSNKICEECDNKLSSFYDLKTELVKKQEKLYELLGNEAELRAEQSTAFQENSSIADLLTDPLSIKLEPQTEPEIQIVNIKQIPLEAEFAVTLDQCCPTSAPSGLELNRANLYEILSKSLTLKKLKRSAEPLLDNTALDESLKRSDADANPHPALQKYSWTLEEPEFFELSEDDNPTVSTKKKRIRKMHISKIELACDLCPYRTYVKNYLKNHMRGHLPKELRWRKCNLCPRKLISRLTLLSHMKRFHSNSRPFKCTLCDKAYTARGDLIRHIQDCHNGRNFVCDQCGERFASVYGLQSHMKNMHPSGPKDEFPCDKCDSVLRSYKGLRRHNIVAHEAPKLKCNYCEEMFHSPANRRIHEDSTHLGISHLCEFCPRTYKAIRGLQKHLKKRHGKK